MNRSRILLLASATWLGDLLIWGLLAREFGVGRIEGMLGVMLILSAFLAFGLYDFSRPQPRGLRLVGLLSAASIALALSCGLGFELRATRFELPSWLGTGIGLGLLGVASSWLGREGLNRLSARILRKDLHLDGNPEACDAFRKALKHLPAAPIRLVEDVNAATWCLPKDFGQSQRSVEQDDLTMFAYPWPSEGGGGRWKRFVDLLGAGLLLILAAPVLAAGVLACAIVQGRPILYGQVRLTEGERRFQIYKLRSMHRDAEGSGEAIWPQRVDGRTTGLGAFLRRTWIDELPQIWNVLRGDLSLIGPRPERPEFAQVFTKSMTMYPSRHRARAGLTGLAQAEGYVGNTSLRQRVRLDLVYVENWSPCLDLVVVLKTLRHFVLRKSRRQFDFVPGRDLDIP